LRKKPRRCSNFVHEIAPGETKKLSVWIRKINYDILGFPELFPNGKGGLHDKSRKSEKYLQYRTTVKNF
jgi:hypothetical protein